MDTTQDDTVQKNTINNDIHDIDSEIEKVRHELEKFRRRYSCHPSTIQTEDGCCSLDEEREEQECNSNEKDTTTYLNMFLQLEKLRDEYEIVRSNYLSLIQNGRSDGRTLYLYTDAIMDVYNQAHKKEQEEQPEEEEEQQQQKEETKNNSSLIGLQTQVVRSFHQICNLDIQHQLCYSQSKQLIKYMEQKLAHEYETKSKEESQHLTTLCTMTQSIGTLQDQYEELVQQSATSYDSLRKTVEATQCLHSFLMPIASKASLSSGGGSGSSSSSSVQRQPSSPSSTFNTTKQTNQEKKPQSQQPTSPSRTKQIHQNKENDNDSETPTRSTTTQRKKKTLRPSTNKMMKQQKRLSSLKKSVSPPLTFVEREKETTEEDDATGLHGSIAIRRSEKGDANNDNASTISTTSSLTMETNLNSSNAAGVTAAPTGVYEVV